MQQTYDDIVAAGYQPDVVRVVLEAWATEGAPRQWPAWAPLKATFDEETTRRHRKRAIASTTMAGRETFCARCYRLGIDARRLSGLGTGRYRPIMDRHRQISDQAIIVAFDRLDRGLTAFHPDEQAPEHQSTLPQMSMAEVIAALNDPAQSQAGYEPVGAWRPLGGSSGRSAIISLGVAMGLVEVGEDGKVEMAR